MGESLKSVQRRCVFQKRCDGNTPPIRDTALLLLLWLLCKNTGQMRDYGQESTEYDCCRGIKALAPLSILPQPKNTYSNTNFNELIHPYCLSLVAPSLCLECQTAVDDCLERVLGPGAEPASAFAVVFFEGHDQAGVQDALNSFAER